MDIRPRIEIYTKSKGEMGVLKKTKYLPAGITREDAEELRISLLEKYRSIYLSDSSPKIGLYAEICGQI